MPVFKLLEALPQSAPGSTETHYGHKCEVRNDGVYIELTDEATIANFKAGRRIDRPVEEVKKVVVAEENVEESPQTMTDVIENGSGKRVGRPPKGD